MRFLLLFVLLTFIHQGHAAQNQSVGVLSGCTSIDASSVNIPAAFGSAGAAVCTGLSGKTRIYLASTVSTRIAVSIKTSTTNCSGGTDDFVLPASATAVLENLAVNATVCVRSLTGSAIASGLVDASAW